MSIEKTGDRARRADERTESERPDERRRDERREERSGRAERRSESFRDAMERADRREQRGRQRRKEHRSSERRHEAQKSRQRQRDGESRLERRERGEEAKKKSGDRVERDSGARGADGSERGPGAEGRDAADAGELDSGTRRLQGGDTSRATSTGRTRHDSAYVEQIANQMVEAIRVGRDEQRRQVVMLDVKVPGRGGLRIRMRKQGEGYDVRFRPEEASLGKALQRESSVLREAAEHRGVRLERITVAANS